MAEQRPIPPPESTESLLKKLCFILAESRQDVADKFYLIMRDFLSAGSKSGRRPTTPKGVSPNASLWSGPSPSPHLGDDDFLIEHEKVLHYLLKIDQNTAKEFSALSNEIQHGKNIMLSDRTASLKFLLKLGRKSEKSDDLILEHAKFMLPDIVSKKDGRAPGAAENVSPSTSGPSTPTVEELFPLKANNSLSSVTSTNKSVPSSANISRGRSPVVSASVHQRCGYHRPPDSGFGGSHSWGLTSRQFLSKSDDIESKYADFDGVLSEWDIIRGIIFTWQGIEGEIFLLNPTTQMYYIDEKFTLDKSVREKAENLALLGYLHNVLNKYTQETGTGGMVRKCLIGYIRDQLSDYYTLIANIQTQDEINRETVGSSLRKSLVTFERLQLLSLYPSRNFQDLISILEFTESDEGGILASRIHSFIEHGDPELQSLVKSILSEICKPLYSMLTKWLLDGELCDPFKEFFIASDNSISGDRLWHEKYTIRIKMLPEFISVQLAEKILSVGKSINFLREICCDEQPFSERDKIKEVFLNTDVEVMYLLEKEDEMQSLIDPAYKQTNKRVMDVLINKYSLLDHFQAHRKYLLLGQGDFIHHFMDLLVEVLERPADYLHPHHLNGILDSAIRATTAQFDDENILNRLDAATMNHSRGDTGWDVFYLRYHVDGPIGTVFSLSKEVYQLLFYALWKAKRMEMVLSKLWKKQITSAKTFRKVKELSPMMRQCNELTSEMVHFIRQTQYYFLFEVLECSWNRLIQQVHQAESLDEVISAHQQFLMTVKSGVFKDEYHEDLSNQLCIVYDLILQLHSQVEVLLSHSQKEINERSGRDTSGSADEKSPTNEDYDYQKKRKEFILKFVPSANANLKILAKTYRDTVKKFLLMLNSQNNLNLQLLSIRLDFNEHYKNLDSRVVAPLTFQHRRLSSVGDSNNSSPLLSRKLTNFHKTNEEFNKMCRE